MNHFLFNIKINVPYNLILARLGYKKGKTNLDFETEKLINNMIDEALILIEPKAVYSYIKIDNLTEDFVVLDNGFKIKSKNIAKLLKKSTEVVLLAGTIGDSLGNQVKEYINKKELSSAAILDAIGSELADEVANHINNIVKKEAFIKKAKTTFRYSPGYGDWKLDAQKEILNILNADKIGLSVNDSFILIPEKSVTALIGIEPSSDKNYCVDC